MKVEVVLLIICLIFCLAESLRMQSNPITLLALHNAHSDEELTEDEMYSDDDNSAAGSLSKPPHSGLQFMITQKMRAKLLEELGYTSDEVDDMEPQIAAVVIERSLRRPLKGMPASWRRPEAVAERRRREFARRVHAFQSSLWGIWRFGQLYIRPLLPYVVVSSAVWYQRDSISHLLQSLWKSLQSARYSWSSRRPFFRARFPFPSQPSPPLSDKDKDRVDLEALNRALRQSFLEKLDLRRQARSGST